MTAMPARKRAAAAAFPAESIEFFEARVGPVLVGKCFKCHGEKKQSNGLRLDSREAALKGGDTGPALVAGKPDESLLVQAVAQTHAELKMPPSGKLPDSDVAALKQWVAQRRAPWPWPQRLSPAECWPSGRRGPRRGEALGVSGEHRSAGCAAGRQEGFARCRSAARRVCRREARGGGGMNDVAAGLEANADQARDAGSTWGIPAGRRRKPAAAFEADSIARCICTGWSTGCWRRRATVSGGAGTGWTWPVTPTPRGMFSPRTAGIPTRIRTGDYVIGGRFNSDLGFDQFVVQQIGGRSDCRRWRSRRTIAAMGFLIVGRRFLLDQKRDHRRPDRRGVAEVSGLDGHVRRCHDHKFDPDSFSRIIIRCTGCLASSVEPAGA